MDTTLDGTLNLDANIVVSIIFMLLVILIDFNFVRQGNLDSGLIPLFTVGIPGLDFGGCVSISFPPSLEKEFDIFTSILKVGPTFNINAEATVTIDLELDMAVDINYQINNLQLFFPAQQGHTSAVDVSPQDSRACTCLS